MSSEVQAKWRRGARSAIDVAASFWRRKYSTALTSWFVVASIAFTAAASSTEKPSAMRCSAAASSAESARASGMPGSSHSARSHAISTRTRRWIRPASEKTARRGAVCRA
jgi:hypothetical protein